MPRLLYSEPLTPQQATVDSCLCRRLLDTHRPSMAQSLVESLILFPGSWCTQGFVCALQESVCPVLWKFSNQIPLAFKVNFPGGSKSLCRIPRLRNLSWAPALSQHLWYNCSPIHRLSAWWLYGGAHTSLRSAAARAPAPAAGYC